MTPSGTRISLPFTLLVAYIVYCALSFYHLNRVSCCLLSVFEPTCAYARWAVMHHAMSVFMSVTWKKITGKNPIL